MTTNLLISDAAAKAVGLHPHDDGHIAQAKSYTAALLTLLEQGTQGRQRLEAVSFVEAAGRKVIAALQQHKAAAPVVQHPRTTDDTEGGSID